MEGDFDLLSKCANLVDFNPLPPHGGRHSIHTETGTNDNISIHSLRMEGDYAIISLCPLHFAFQSTPSAWRETSLIRELSSRIDISIHSLRMEGDRGYYAHVNENGISIHSLRMEGDLISMLTGGNTRTFQSTPSAWRETFSHIAGHNCMNISIHSLRMEGDGLWHKHFGIPEHFNPLPPHGGRQETFWQMVQAKEFQSTPSAWRETRGRHPGHQTTDYFNPLPPHGGRQRKLFLFLDVIIFQSTPSAWRETWAVV